MKKILAIITLLLFLVLLWCTKDKYSECCGDNNNNVVTEQNSESNIKGNDSKTIKDGPLVYKWNSSEAITNDLWDTKKATVLSERSEGKILQIVGPYLKGEDKEIGIARAKAAFAKLESDIDSKTVEFSSKLINGDKSKHFGETDFNWLTRNDNITEIDNKTLIYFPSNSTKKLNNTNIISYLKNVAKALQGNNKTISLSGHSDSRGNARKNKQLALGRANSIKNELVRLGVKSSRIFTISYGEEKPIADNSTKAGQQKNRRVELEIK